MSIYLYPAFIACFTSFIVDYIVTRKMGGTNLNYFIAKQLPILPPSLFLNPAPWSSKKKLIQWITPRVLELVYVANDLKPFANDFGYDGEPFPWNEQRRFQLRCELDAAFFILYGIERDDMDYILEQFPAVKRSDESHYKEYRTKRVIFEYYDKMKLRNDFSRFGEIY